MFSRSDLSRLTLGCALVLPAVGGWMHTHLVKALPGKDEVVREAPAQVRLWFSSRPEVALTSITLLARDSTPVARLGVAATDDSLSVAGKLPIALKPGAYIVVWRTSSNDGHTVRGRYAFTYDAAAPGASSSAAAPAKQTASP
jgi:methionine-rich copper-binding protein CopC